MAHEKNKQPKKPVPPQKSSGSNKKKSTQPGNTKTWLYLAGILILTCIVYAKSLSGMILHWDDNTYILESGMIQKLNMDHFKQFFSSFYAFNYHPFTTLSWAIEYAAIGDKSGYLYHFDNLVLHLMNTLLVFWVFRLISKNNAVALLVALFHAIHPAHVESVAWISERKDVLYSFFFLLSLGFYVNYLRDQKLSDQGKETGKKTMSNFILCLLFFLCSLFSKSAAVVLPVVLILVDLLEHRKINMKMFAEKIPFFALSVLFGMLALHSQEKAIQNETHYTLLQSILIVNYTVLKYLLMVFLPVQLSSFHPWPELTENGLPIIYYIGPFISILLISFVIYSLKKSRLPAFAMLFFLVNLALVLQVIPVGEAVMAERYTYIPFLGIFYLAAVYLVKWYENKRPKLAMSRSLILLLLIVGSVFFSYATIGRVKIWQNDKELWNDMIVHYPQTAYKAYLNRSKFRTEQGDVKGAYDDLSILVKAKKYYSEALSMRGSIIADSGNYAAAFHDFDEAIKFDSTYYLAYNNRGAARMNTNDLKGAQEDFNRSIQLKNDYDLSWFNRGAVKISLRNFAGAIADFDQALTINPGYCKAMFAKGATWADSGQSKQALEAYDAAIRCDARYVAAYTNRGSLKLELNDLQGAAEDFKSAIQIDPGYYLAYFNLGKTKIRSRDYAGAREDLNKCIAINPSNPLAYTQLGSCSYNSGDKTAACNEWKQGAQLGDAESAQMLNIYCR